jgi:hypothetical protein
MSIGATMMLIMYGVMNYAVNNVFLKVWGDEVLVNNVKRRRLKLKRSRS